MASYCTIAQLYERYDKRMVDQLSNDANTTAPNAGNVQAAIDDGAADILTATLRGKQYTAIQLDVLVASGDKVLVRLNADIAMRHMARRRGLGVAQGLESAFERSEKFLRQLSGGDRVLNIDANRSGDTPEVVISQNIQTLARTDPMVFNNDFFRGLPGTGIPPITLAP